ncbi:MAG: hypothetical protein JWR07_1284 [Nevskia sp.]|nr:hypothetical protein [Nevskia sp.]
MPDAPPPSGGGKALAWLVLAALLILALVGKELRLW